MFLRIARNQLRKLPRTALTSRKISNLPIASTLQPAPTMALRSWFNPAHLNPFFMDPFYEPESVPNQPEQQVTTRTPSDFFHRHSLLAGPPTDIHDVGDCLIVTAELPGVKKEDVSVSLDERHRRLTISGHFKSEFTTGGGNEGTTEEQQQKDQQQQKKNGAEKVQHIMGKGKHGPRPLVSERSYGSFSRSWVLPTSIQTDHPDIKAQFQDGVLRLCIPKKPQSEKKEPRSITVE